MYHFKKDWSLFMLRNCPVLCIVACSTFTASAAIADRQADCLRSQDLTRTIHGCSEIIENGKRESRASRVGAYNNRGNAYYTNGDFLRALNDYSQAILINPIIARSYYNRGNTYIAMADFDRAISDLNKAIQLNPKYWEAYVDRGVSHRGRGSLDRAISDYNQAIQLNPGFAEAYVNLGVAYKEKNQLDRAIEEFSKAIKINAEFAVR